MGVDARGWFWVTLTTLAVIIGANLFIEDKDWRRYVILTSISTFSGLVMLQWSHASPPQGESSSKK